DDVEEGGEIVEATPEELAASEAESEEGSDLVDPDADLQDPNANLNDPNVNPSEDPNAPRQERDPNAPEPKPDLSHIPPLRAQMKARAKAMKLKDSGVYAYVPEAMDGRPMLLLSQPGGAVPSRMRMVGPVGEEGRYRCTALGSIALTHGSFSLGPLARHLGVKLRFAPIPVEKPRKMEAVPVTIPVPPPPTSGLLRRPRADTILAPASGLSNRVLTGARGKIMAVGLQEGGRVTLTTSPPKVERITFSGGGGKGAALPGAVRALERSGVLKDLKEISGASVGSMTAAMVAVGVTAEEFEEMGNDPSVAAQIKEGKNMVEVLFGGGLDGLGLENLVRAKASDCLRKRLSEHIEAQESSGAEVEPEVHRIFNRLADGKKGPTFGELRILSKIIPAVKEVAISGSYVAELDGATKRPLPQAKPQLVMFNADTEPDMEIALAVHASAALPPVFKSVDLQLSSGIWVRFQDGGVLNNAPAAETLGVERNLDPLPESGGMTFVFEEEASKEIVKGKAVPRRDRVADWITGAGNSAAEYAKNRALADRPEDVVVV
ncbi:MAG TPA: patatin-like phospholipase family protein, partial [Myxococcota bacterium]|nr:patatin-like phospholipase family protein [Myxococcota bacterium]